MSTARRLRGPLVRARVYSDDPRADSMYDADYRAELAEARDAWWAAWPRACPGCCGWGGRVTTEMHGFRSGPGEHLFTLCGVLDDTTCHRCGEPGLTEAGTGPCTACGWDFDDGQPA